MRKRLPGSIVLLLLLLAATLVVPAQTPAPQPQPPATPPAGASDQPPMTFKVEVNYVEVDAIVTDQQGNFVRDLTKDDFQILEQGKPQTVANFSLVDIPVESSDPPLFRPTPIEPDVRSNRNDFNGRIFVIVLDDLNTAFSRSSRVKTAARQFIERYLGANDVAAIVHDRRRQGRQPGVHEQPSAPAAIGRPVHGTEAALADAGAHRRVLPHAGHGPRRAAR